MRFTATVNEHNVGYLDGHTIVPQAANATTTLPLNLTLWHNRCSHLNFEDLNAMHSKRHVTGMKLVSKTPPDPICEPCLAGKMHANPFPSSTSRASRPLELIHSDVHGPLPVQTHSGFRYWVIFVDDCTRIWAVYLMRLKSQTFASFKQFKAYAESLFNARIGTLREAPGGGVHV